MRVSDEDVRETDAGNQLIAVSVILGAIAGLILFSLLA
jgi:hypothetical protein